MFLFGDKSYLFIDSTMDPYEEAHEDTTGGGVEPVEGRDREEDLARLPVSDEEQATSALEIEDAMMLFMAHNEMVSVESLKLDVLRFYRSPTSMLRSHKRVVW